MDADKKVDKKEPTSGNEHINIKVVGGDNNEVFFKIKQSTPLRKLMDAYCERQGKSPGSVRFLYDGHRVLATDTPQGLDMDDGDTIDVMVEQIGGY
ncbi:ubiquitin-related domain-containing protein [Phascolomyces articulosus]|uniref:Ubiquitin-related domain-containing protein n=1 Tax=Phascolomyces articulosus TaxID=60185 RepID=A0AAD5KD94_9FUNG|nr:ubiquitin-related domain-containing protein [Phascolomyces articulosus]